MTIPITFSTEEQESRHFKAHGAMSMTLVDGIIFGQIRGPFNLEFVDAYANVWGKLYKELRPMKPAGSPTVTLTFWSNSMLASPDSLAALEKFLTDTAKFIQPVFNIFFVPADVEARALMVPKWVALFGRAGMTLEVFDDKAQAQQWAKDRLTASPGPGGQDE